MKILSQRYKFNKVTKNAIKYVPDDDKLSHWIPYAKTLYLSAGEWQVWCDKNDHDPEETPLYLDVQITTPDIEPGTGGKEPSAPNKSLK
jgi:hypothetical protein